MNKKYEVSYKAFNKPNGKVQRVVFETVEEAQRMVVVLMNEGFNKVTYKTIK